MERFDRSSRLLRPSEFESTFSKGRRITQKPVGLVYAGNQIGKARLGLAISKKAVPLATRRNRFKRVIRDAFRRQAAELPHVDMVIYMQPGNAALTAPECRRILLQLWVKLSHQCAPC